MILHGRTNSEQLQQTSQSIEAIGREVRQCCCDFSDPESVPAFANEVWHEFGELHIVVNNAGGDVLTGKEAELSSVEKLDYLYATDCRATFQLSRLLGTKMKSAAQNANEVSGTRSIINIGWDQAFQGMAGDSGEYFSTIKGSIMSLTLSLAQSLAPEIRVNCVAPGWIKTDWGNQTSEYWNRRAAAESLMNRWGTPADVANAVSFLVSDQASFVSAQILNINGGFRFNPIPND